MRFLIADDHAIVRKGLVQILREEFPLAEITEVSNSHQVMEQVDAQPWDVIMLDISMPGRSGLDVVQHVKQNFPKLPVLILSIHPEEQYAIRALKAGAAGYLSKDAATDELVKAVQKILQGRKYISASLAEIMASELDQNGVKLPHELLSDRELHVFKLIAGGKGVTEIAENLSLSITTVSTYRARILEKMDIRTNADMTRYALENKLI